MPIDVRVESTGSAAAVDTNPAYPAPISKIDLITKFTFFITVRFELMNIFHFINFDVFKSFLDELPNLQLLNCNIQTQFFHLLAQFLDM